MHRFLWFRNGTGSATCGNVVLHFTACPRLPGMRFVEIEFMPRVKSRVLAEEDPEHWREMTDVECAIAESALQRMHDQAMVAFA
jgi:hypothetical protein